MCHGKVYSERIMKRMPIMKEYTYMFVAEKKSVEDIAAEANVSEEFVREIFKDVIEINPCMAKRFEEVL